MVTIISIMDIGPISYSFLMAMTFIALGTASAIIAMRSLPRSKRQRALEEMRNEIAIIDEKRDRLRSDYEAYRNLMVTRSKELTLKKQLDLSKL